ncbi:sugar nucleotide-binding protein [Prochlorococcus sp. AH-716-E13]|nr:sugar nucleotide-binding protein [Prochlorococcus sp. AH-716-E13]
MSILVIGNEGNLSLYIGNILKKRFSIKLVEIEKKSNLSKILLRIDQKLNKFNFKYLVYLGGETRDQTQMKKVNDIFLIEISKLCEKSKTSLIYLGSISVYGIPNNRVVNNKSDRKPFNLYGQTKNSADIYFMNRINKKIKIFNILPASIISNSKNNFYTKLRKFLKTQPAKISFSILCPGGQFNFCSYEDISNEIINAINFSESLKENDQSNQIYYYEKIISKGIKIKDLFFESNNYYPYFVIPTLDLNLLRRFLFFVNPKILLRLIFLFSIIDYRNINSKF